MAIVTNGLLYYWHASDGLKAGNTLRNIAPDGTPHTMAVSGATPQADGSLLMDSVDDTLSVSPTTMHNQFAQPFSIDFYLKATTASQITNALLMSGGVFAGRYSFVNFLVDFMAENGSYGSTQTTSNVLNTLNPLLFTMTYNGSNNLSVYVNGSRIINFTLSSRVAVSNTSYPVLSIMSPAVGNRGWNGNFYGLRLYNRVLSTAEMEQNRLNGTAIGLPDTTPPSEVTSLTESHTHDSITLSWTNPTDGDFSHVRILRDGIQIVGNETSVTYTDTNLTPETLYSYVIKTVDTVGNESVGSPITVTTSPTPIYTRPQVIVRGISRKRISDESNMDISVITFRFSEDVSEWVVRVNGVDHSTGFQADSGGMLAQGNYTNAEIDWTELYQEGVNRVNIYGRGMSGAWTPYRESLSIDCGMFSSFTIDEIYDGGNFMEEQDEEDVIGGEF